MAKEKKSFKFRLWIIIIFFYVVDDIDWSWIDTGADRITVVVGLLIIVPILSVIIGKIGHKKLKKSVGQQGNATVDGEDASRIEVVEQKIQEAMPNEHVDGTKNKKYIPQYKDTASHDYSSKELKSNYNVAKKIKKDDMTGSETNPLSLDGK